MLFLRRQLLPLLRSVSSLPSRIHHRARIFSISTSAPAAPFSLEEYLVAACGLAPDQARKTAQKAFDGASRESRKAFKEISNCRLNSASNPDAVLKLLSGVGLSRDDIQFLIKEVGLEPQYIVQRPSLFAYSLEKRLGPRHFVMKVLLAKGLLDRNTSFWTLAHCGEATFKLRYIDRHRDSVPGLADAYATACGGTVPSAV